MGEPLRSIRRCGDRVRWQGVFDDVGRDRPAVVAELQAQSASSRLDADRLDQLLEMERPLIAPVAGVYDEARRSVRSHGMDVVVQLTPIQSLRYQSLTFTGAASVETIVGDRTVDCQAVWIGSSVAPTDPASPDGDAQPSGEGDELHCRLSSSVETAAGIRAELFLRSEVIEDAVVIPNRSIGYDADADSYYVNVIEDPIGAREVRRVDVAVGATDGVVGVVTSELPIGAELAPIESE